MGGVKVDGNTCSSKVPGLYAAGEVSGGMHGANRLGGNSLSDLLVFGKRAGSSAAQYANSLGSSSTSITQDYLDSCAKELLEPFENTDGENPYTIHQDLQDIMHTYVGVFRNEENLKTGVEKLNNLKERAKKLKIEGSVIFNPGWHLCRDLKSMLIVSEALARCALQREESRGAHSRVDFPESNDEKWIKVNSVVSLEGENMNVDTIPLNEMPEELKKLFTED